MSFKYIGDANSEIFELEVYECEACGFHMGFDCSYLDQVGGITGICPSCDTEYVIDAYEEELP